MKQISMTAEKIAEIVQGSVCGDPQRQITGVSGIKDAAENQLSFVGNKRYEELLDSSKAGIVLVCKDLEKEDHISASRLEIFIVIPP